MAQRNQHLSFKYIETSLADTFGTFPSVGLIEGALLIGALKIAQCLLTINIQRIICTVIKLHVVKEASQSSSSLPFSGIPTKSKNRYLSVEIRFRISRSIANPKSGFSKSKSRFPNRTYPKTIFWYWFCFPSSFCCNGLQGLKMGSWNGLKLR